MTASQFVQKLSDYFGDEKTDYNDTQMSALTRWAERNYKALDRVYDSLIEKKDWRGQLPLVSTMHKRAEELGLLSPIRYPVPDDKPQECKACGNLHLENHNEVQLCRKCNSMWVWMNTGKWHFAPSQEVVTGRFAKKKHA